MIADMIVTIHWGDHYFAIIFHISAEELIEEQLTIWENQLQMFLAYQQSNIMWLIVFVASRHKQQIDVIEQPLSIKLSSVGSLLCMTLHTLT